MRLIDERWDVSEAQAIFDRQTETLRVTFKTGRRWFGLTRLTQRSFKSAYERRETLVLQYGPTPVAVIYRVHVTSLHEFATLQSLLHGLLLHGLPPSSLLKASLGMRLPLVTAASRGGTFSMHAARNGERVPNGKMSPLEHEKIIQYESLSHASFVAYLTSVYFSLHFLTYVQLNIISALD